MGNIYRSLCGTIADSSFWNFVGADDLCISEIRQSPIEFEDAYPFDRIGTDSDATYVIAFKSFAIGSLSSSVTTPVFKAYLRSLMPEFYSIHAVLEEIWIEWKLGGVDDILGESFDRLSPTTKALLDGSVTVEKLYGDFMTPETIASLSSIRENNRRLTDAEMVKVFLEGQSPVLASGLL